jgi:regulator of protease activity HflC (stomatin/prohibitin superfamily)
VIQAQAAANVRIAQATGEAQSTVVAAQANLTAAKLNAEAAALTGQGEANRQKAIITTFGSVDKYIQYEYAERWSGNYPTVLSNGTGGTNTVIIPSLPQQFGVTAPTSTTPASPAP